MSGSLSLKSVFSDFTTNLSSNVSAVDINTVAKIKDSLVENHLNATSMSTADVNSQPRDEDSLDENHLETTTKSRGGIRNQPWEDGLDRQHMIVSAKSALDIRSQLTEDDGLHVKYLKVRARSTVDIKPQICKKASFDEKHQTTVNSVARAISQTKKVKETEDGTAEIKSQVKKGSCSDHKYVKDTAQNVSQVREENCLDLNVSEICTAGVSPRVKSENKLNEKHMKEICHKGAKASILINEDDHLEEKHLKERIRTVLNHGLDDKQLILLYINHLYTDSVITLYDEESAVAPKEERGSWSNILNRPSPGYLEEIVVYSVLPERQYPEVVYIEKRKTLLRKMWNWTKKKFNTKKEPS